MTLSSVHVSIFVSSIFVRLKPFTSHAVPISQMTYICVGNLTIIGSENACRLVGAEPLYEPMFEYC